MIYFNILQGYYSGMILSNHCNVKFFYTKQSGGYQSWFCENNVMTMFEVQKRLKFNLDKEIIQVINIKHYKPVISFEYIEKPDFIFYSIGAI